MFFDIYHVAIIFFLVIEAKRPSQKRKSDDTEQQKTPDTKGAKKSKAEIVDTKKEEVSINDIEMRDEEENEGNVASKKVTFGS